MATTTAMAASTTAFAAKVGVSASTSSSSPRSTLVASQCSGRRRALAVTCAAQQSQKVAVEELPAVLAGAFFSLAATTGSAAAAQEAVAQVVAADLDARPLTLAVLLAAAIGWVLFNIGGPALSQVNKMRGVKGVLGAVGLSAAASALFADSADAAQEVAQLADGTDARPLILLLVLGPAVGWVLFNILQPALNQFNKMAGSKKAVVGALGLSAASLLAPAPSEAAQELYQTALDQRPLILLLPVVAAAGWVLFNIAVPALNQLKRMQGGGKRK